ncbi:MAG: MerR family transcriptional regulator [Cyanobacteria bacterium P01_A01_bin.116]
MATELSIQEVATLTQLSAYTLRYYERVGLVNPVGRTPSGHRRYASKDITWLEFVTRLRATGMSIKDMQQFAQLRRQGDRTIAQRRQLLETHQQHVARQLVALEQNAKVLNEKILYYKELENKHDAHTP